MNKTNIIILFLALISIKTTGQIKPWELYPELFHDVQMARIFKDSKTFADCIPCYEPEDIKKEYQQLKLQNDFSLEQFILSHFSLPASFCDYKSDTSLSVEAHIQKLWNILKKEPDTDSNRNSSLIPLPFNYIIPGGRFREVYYWDTYFTLLGLEGNNDSLLQSMVANFGWLIDQYGFIPNGNRTYYLSRSQPPFFSLMVSLLSELKGDTILSYYLPQLEKEYYFWMQGKDSVTSKAYKRVIRLGKNQCLNRYWDDSPLPRPESYREDILLQESTYRKREDIYRNIRAAAESGWDFSSRWLKDPQELNSIHTIDIIPPDLNSLLYYLELTISRAANIKGDYKKSKDFKTLSTFRRKLIKQYCWDPKSKWFHDFDFVTEKKTSTMSLAGVYPFFMKMVPQNLSSKFAKNIREHFLKEGGLVTSLTDSKEQWDYPNGWPPLQFLTIVALQNYGQHELAEQCISRWLKINERVYKSTGRMVEKYDVVKVNRPAGGGEYPTQDGFGWTNGIYLFLKRNHKK